jgi:hypothetical protein
MNAILGIIDRFNARSAAGVPGFPKKNLIFYIDRRSMRCPHWDSNPD